MDGASVPPCTNASREVASKDEKDQDGDERWLLRPTACLHLVITCPELLAWSTGTKLMVVDNRVARAHYKE